MINRVRLSAKQVRIQYQPYVKRSLYLIGGKNKSSVRITYKVAKVNKFVGTGNYICVETIRLPVYPGFSKALPGAGPIALNKIFRCAAPINISTDPYLQILSPRCGYKVNTVLQLFIVVVQP